MPKFFKPRAQKAGLPPGSLIQTPGLESEPVKITLMDFDADNVRERDLNTVSQALPFKDAPSVTWINIDGLHNVRIIEEIGRRFDIHALILEDIMSYSQRPKMDDFEDYLFIVINMIKFLPEGNEIVSEQVSLVLGDNYLFSFQEIQGDVFDPIRERIRRGKGRIRRGGPTFLAYSLIDAVVDHYFVVLEHLGSAIEDVEEKLLDENEDDALQSIQELKREMIFLHKQVRPIREVVDKLKKSDSALLGETIGVYLTDVHDHVIQVVEIIESYRDMLSGLLELYQSTVNQKMNQVMQVLTTIATVFIPLTFLSGIYGMNFKYMPELEWRYGYLFIWVIFLLVALCMIIVFKKKKWW